MKNAVSVQSESNILSLMIRSYSVSENRFKTCSSVVIIAFDVKITFFLIVPRHAEHTDVWRWLHYSIIP